MASVRSQVTVLLALALAIVAAAGYLTGHFDVVSVSAAASTGIMDLRSNQWSREMLGCLVRGDYRELVDFSHRDNLLLHHFSLGSKASRTAG